MVKGKSLDFQGLTEFQNDLLGLAQKDIPKEMNKTMKKVGNRGATWARRYARAELKTQPTGKYMKGIKSGKAFIDNEGKHVVRILNTAPHGHLLERGYHIRKEKDGPSLGFVPGKHIIEKAGKQLEDSGDFETLLSRGVDDMIRKKGL